MSKLWRLVFYFSFPVEGWSVSPDSINIHHIIPINIPINVRRHSLPCPKECLTNVFLMMMDKKILASEYLPRNHCTAFKQYLDQLFTSRQVILSQKRLLHIQTTDLNLWNYMGQKLSMYVIDKYMRYLPCPLFNGSQRITCQPLRGKGKGYS